MDAERRRCLADDLAHAVSAVGRSHANSRQPARVTVEDQAIETHAFSFLQPGVEPFASHLIAVQAYDRRTPTEPPYSELS